MCATNLDLDPQASTWRPTLRHSGECGRRVRCFRSSCREQFGEYATVEVLRSEIRFYCHLVVVPVDELMMQMLETAA